MLVELLAGTLTVTLLLGLMAGLYVLAALASARVSGWSRLHRLYGAGGRRATAPIRTPRARIGGVIYRNIVGYEASGDGLILQCHFLDRLAHPTLLIPWSDVGAPRSVSLEQYLPAGLDPSVPFVRRLLVRIGLREMSRGLEAARDLRNLEMEIDPGDGEPVRVELLGRRDDLAPHVSLLPDGRSS